jgi:peptidoglycan LD-endopeptidase LytH
MKPIKLIIIIAAVITFLIVGYFVIRSTFRPARYAYVGQWLRHPEDHQDWASIALSSCDDAPFIFPTNGYIGFLWGDSFRIGHSHQGLDIFSGTETGITPVYAAFDGYLTRMADWKASIIIRIPNDPLNPGHQIWTYYTHMADEAGNSYVVDQFPAGTNEVFIKAGTLLGYQGNYSGSPGNPTGIHLHFSIVRDDGQGRFLNELEIKNTIDPSPYFNLDLNGKLNQDSIPICPSKP